MSFESLVKKLMKEGKSKTAATKIAGSIANAKMKGAGSGPTAKQKARAKSPATKKDKPRAVIRDKDRVADKSKSYTDKKGRKIEIKTFKYKKKYDSGVKDDPNKPSMKRKSSRLSNTVELHKTKTKKDGTTKTKVKRAAGGGKKSQRLHTKFAKGKNKEGSSDVTITRKSPATMKKSPSKMKSPAKKPLVGGQKKLPKELQEAILKSPGKMLSKSGIKMMDKSPAKMKAPMKKSKQKVEQDYARNAIADYKSGKTKEAKYEKKKALEVAAGESPAKMKKPSKKRAKLMDKVEKFDNLSSFRGRPGNLKPRKNEGSEKRSDKRMDRGFDKADKKMSKVMAIDSPAKMKMRKAKKAVKKGMTPDEASNKGLVKNKDYNKLLKSRAYKKQRADEAGYKSVRKAKKAAKANDGFLPEGPAKMKKSPGMMKTNQSGGGYAAKNMAAPARQLKKLGSVLSKHFKSNR